MALQRHTEQFVFYNAENEPVGLTKSAEQKKHARCSTECFGLVSCCIPKLSLLIRLFLRRFFSIIYTHWLDRSRHKGITMVHRAVPPWVRKTESGYSCRPECPPLDERVGAVLWLTL